MNKIAFILFLLISQNLSSLREYTNLCKNFSWFLYLLAPIIRPCLRNSPYLADCVKNAIETLRPQITSGIIPPNIVLEDRVDPLLIDEIKIQRNVNMVLRNLKIKGIKDFKIEKLRINPNDFKVN